MSDENHVEENAKPASTDGKSFNWGCLIWLFVGVTCVGILLALLFPGNVYVGNRLVECNA